jgi:hypothetical protein
VEQAEEIHVPACAVVASCDASMKQRFSDRRGTR